MFRFKFCLHGKVLEKQLLQSPHCFPTHDIIAHISVHMFQVSYVNIFINQEFILHIHRSWINLVYCVLNLVQ